MAKRFNIITNLTNGVGLQRDYELLKNVLESAGHEVKGIHFNNLKNTIQAADVNIFIEVVEPVVFSWAKENWLIPNPEWWFDNLWNKYLPNFSKVLCKTQDCLRIFRKLVGDRAEFIGFESRDFYCQDIQKELKFLHVAGRSMWKNTDAVINAWRFFRIPHQLTLLTSVGDFVKAATNVKNINVLDRISDDALVELLNSSRFHICPSHYEGWGHYLHEGLGVGAVVITTDAPPMNEFSGVDKFLKIIPHRVEPIRLAQLHYCNPSAIYQKVRFAARLDEQILNEIGSKARTDFLEQRDNFRRRFVEIANQ